MKIRFCTLVLLSLSLLACGNPDGSTPGMTLTGEVVTDFPPDWSFTQKIPEIALEVETPYLFHHSVTIWCVSVDGKLYVAALDPESKQWPGWARRNPAVRLLIEGRIYPATLEFLDDPTQTVPVAAAYAKKYHRTLPEPGGEAPKIWYWRVLPRS